MSDVFQEGKQPGDEGLKDESKVDDPTLELDDTVDTDQVDGAQKRIDQIYKRMKDSERDLQSERNALNAERESRLRLEERLRDVEERRTDQTKPAQLTETDLQAALDVNDGAAAAKIITAMSKQEVEKASAVNSKRSNDRLRLQSQIAIAQRQVSKYMTSDSTLKDHTNPKWGDVEDAYRANKEIGVPDDARAELLALNAVFGSPNKSKPVETKRPIDGFTETGAGGGFGKSSVTGVKGLDNVPQHFVDHWTRQGRSRDWMVKEASFIDPRRLTKKN